MNKRWSIQLCLPIVVIVIILSAFIAPVFAQSSLSVSIDEIRDGNFPLLDLFVSVLDEQGYPITGLTKENFSLSEDANIVDDFSVGQITELPLAINLVVDASNPMSYGESPTPIEAVCTSVSELLNSLSVADRVGAIAFSDDVSIIQGLTEDKNQVQAAICALQPQGSRALNDSLMEAIDRLKNTTERRVLVLVAGNKDSAISEATFDDVIEEAVANDIVVHTIGWSGADKGALENLSRLTHGTSQFLGIDQPELADFQATFRNIAGFIPEQRLQYHLNYTSGLTADNNEHQSRVSVDHLGRHAENNRGFIATPKEVSVTLPDLQDGQVVSGYVNFAPQVIAPADVESMQIKIDGVELALVSAPPFVYAWDSSYSSGKHTFDILVTDANGNQGQAALDLIIEPPISLSITAPTSDQTITGETTISADVKAGSKIARIEFYADDTAIATVDNPSPPYEARWDPAGSVAGLHNIRVKASDVNGFSAEQEVKVTVAQGAGGSWVVVIAAIALAGLLIPLGLRQRRRRSLKEGVVSVKGGVAPIGESSLGAGQAFLREIAGMNINQIWPLSAGETRLGRKRDENDIPLQGLKASRHQAVIRVQNGQHVLVSLRKENLMLVNDQPVYSEQVLQPGDVLRGGDTVLRFEVQG